MIQTKYLTVHTSCECERSVSVIRRLMTYLRTSLVPPPSERRSGGSKVIRRLLRGRREKPGDEATSARQWDN